MKNRFNYHCIQCRALIHSSNQPAQVQMICDDCNKRFLQQQRELSGRKIQIEEKKMTKRKEEYKKKRGELK